jgi:ribonuclease HII
MERRGRDRSGPDFTIERKAMRRGAGPVCGIDEAGRGPWAGPVVAAAVVLDPRRIPEGLDDSKKLTEARREALFTAITASAQVGIGIAEVERIDRDNILAATMWAMGEAVAQLAEKPKLVIIDGNRSPRLKCKSRTIVKGDAKCLSIAAASIVAKVTRDRMMIALAREMPGYGFERHKGYGTPEHQDALRRLGVTAHHRRSFNPVQLALGLVEP